MKVRKKEKGYLCGPMTGLPLKNFPAFTRASAKLRAMGFIVINPCEMNEQDNNFATTVDDTTETIRKFAKRDINVLSKCDSIFVMKNTKHSKGAKAEKAYAKWTRMTFHYLDDEFNIFRTVRCK